MTEIFKRFDIYFGAKWTGSSNEDREKYVELWSDCLVGLTGDEISQGLEDASNMVWPPSVGEFKKMCRPEPAPHKTNWQAYKNRPYKTLANFKPGSIIGLTEMAKIRQVLGMPQEDRDENGNRIIDGEVV